MVLKNKATQTEVLSLMKQGCALLPSSVSGVCSEVVSVYGQQAIDMLVQYLADPSQMCATVGLCNQRQKNKLYKVKYHFLYV